MPHRPRRSAPVPPRARARPGGGLPASFPAWLLVCLLLPHPARAQRLEAAWVSAASGNPEFPTPTGGKIEGLFDLGRGWSLHLGLERVSDETEKETLVCAGYEPQISCQTEATRDDMTLSGFRAGVVRSLFAVGRAEVRVGAGFSFNEIGIESIGLVSGLYGDVYPPSGGQVGALGLVELDVTPVPSVGLAITVGVTEHWVDFDACSANPNRYDPFCSPATFRELELGVAYSPPR